MLKAIFENFKVYRFSRFRNNWKTKRIKNKNRDYKMPKGCTADFKLAGELTEALKLGPTDILQFTETVWCLG